MKDTIPALFLDHLDRDPDRVALLYPEGPVYKAMTPRESGREVARLADGLAALGVGKGTAVGILATTRREWSAVDFATLSLGAVVVGIYPTLLAAQVAWQLEHAQVEILVVEDAEQAAKIEALRDGLPALRRVFSMDPVDGLPSLADLGGSPDPVAFRARCAAVEPGDRATIIYTSGTTGEPKGVVLTHEAFVKVARASQGVVAVQPGDRTVIWLPLAHSFQRFTLYRGLLEDFVGYYARSIDALPEAIAAARPQVLASVPRMLEKIRDRVRATVAERGGAAERLVEWAFGVGRERLGHLERGEPVPPWVALRFRLADRLVLRKIRDRLGGSLRVCVSGGAALDPEVARWFGSMGVLVLEGWGLSETCAPATANTEEAFRFGTVGRALPGVSLRIAPDGEILVKSPGLFDGYHRDEQSTAEAMDDGWFRTGDLGSIDEDGFLSITGRKKAIIVTAGGKNIAPVPIEKRLERHPLVGQAVVVGDERPYLVALLAPDPEAVEGFARRRGWPEESWSRRVARVEVQAAFGEALEQCNEGLARFETVKKFAVVPEPFSVESGELTPTLKLKRRVIAERHAERIAALYGV